MPVYPLHWSLFAPPQEEAVAAFSWTVGFPTQMILLGREEIQTWSKDCLNVCLFQFFFFFFCWHIIHGNIIKWSKNWHNLTLVSATCARLQKSRGAQVTEALQIWCVTKDVTSSSAHMASIKTTNFAIFLTFLFGNVFLYFVFLQIRFLIQIIISK